MGHHAADREEGVEEGQDCEDAGAAGQHQVASQLVMASFYFWNSGHQMQRKQEGLLQSLLFQILRQCPQLIPEICPQRWQADEYFHLHPDPWSRQELSEALSAILVKE